MRSIFFRFHTWKGYAAFIFPCLFFNLCIMPSKLTYVVSNHRIFLFIKLNNLSLGVNTVILVYSCVNEYFHICSTVSTAVIHMGMRICVWHSDLLPLDINSGVGLLDYMVFLLWIFCRKSTTASIDYTNVHSHQQCWIVFSSLHSHQRL